MPEGVSYAYVNCINIIYFSKANLLEIERKLERWFGIDIIVLNQPSTQVSLSTKYNNQSLENILKSLNFSLDCNYEFRDNNVYIQFN